jgi:sugar phosphate isomerase/epimerase
MFRGIGINCNAEVIDGHLDRLKEALARVQQAGFDAYEFSPVAFPIVRHGQIDQAELDRVKAVLARYPMRYTVHPPCNLQLTEPTGLGHQVFRSYLEITAQIHAEVMVYHSAQIALRSADQDTRDLPDTEELRALWQRETRALQELAPEAERRGIVIAVENRDPHLWEFAALKRHGKRAEDIALYHQGMRLDLINEQIKQIAAPNVGICLDVGHAFLAAPHVPGDFLATIRAVAPQIKHLHFHDNFGRLDDWAESVHERLAFGEADSHAPPGWGKIPLNQILSILKQYGYAGWVLLEVQAYYAEHWQELAANVRAMIASDR